MQFTQDGLMLYINFHVWFIYYNQLYIKQPLGLSFIMYSIYSIVLFYAFSVCFFSLSCCII